MINQGELWYAQAFTDAACTGQATPVAVKILAQAAVEAGVRLDGQPLPENPPSEWRTVQYLRTPGGFAGVPDLVTVLNFEHVFCVVMPWYGSRDLFGALRPVPNPGGTGSTSRYPEAEARAAFAQLVSSVSYLHSRGIAHMDISPENAVLSDAGGVHVIDLGVAVNTIAERHTVPRGKSGYCAPEVARGHAQYDPELADVWSLGVLLFVMLTGKHLYKRPDLADPGFSYIAHHGVQAWVHSLAHASGTIEPLSEAAVDVLQRTLTIEPAARITMAELLRHDFVRTAPPAEGYMRAEAFTRIYQQSRLR